MRINFVEGFTVLKTILRQGIFCRFYNAYLTHHQHYKQNKIRYFAHSAYNIYIILLVLLAFSAKGQRACDTLPFINCQENQIIFNYDDSNLNRLNLKFRNIGSDKNGPIQIIHIGDSHLQAGFLTEKIKQNIFQYYSAKDTSVAPGFIFPYTIAETNNPFYYKVSYSGNWDWCKNVDLEKTCGLGLSGITVRTNDSIASFILKMQNQKYKYPKKYYFNKIKILHNIDKLSEIKVNGKNTTQFQGYSTITLENITDSISINIVNNDTSSYFELYGILLETEDANINYHTIGVNGATAQSYLKCNYFSDHLQIINPDLVIISLGTNEAYSDDYSKLENEFILKDLIYQIKDVSPNASIILLTPNDHLKDKYINQNVGEVRDNILNVCNKFQLGLWDFYTIMGGENSIFDWYDNGLSGEDRLHFKRIGYEIQGELFAKAFIDLIENNKRDVIPGDPDNYRDESHTNK